MRIPRTIVIRDSIWSIKFVRKIEAHGNSKRETLGLCDPAEKTIYIKTKLPYQLKIDTALHELIHATEFEYNFELDHKHVYLLGEAFAKLFVDNF